KPGACTSSPGRPRARVEGEAACAASPGALGHSEVVEERGSSHGDCSGAARGPGGTPRGQVQGDLPAREGPTYARTGAGGRSGRRERGAPRGLLPVKGQDAFWKPARERFGWAWEVRVPRGWGARGQPSGPLSGGAALCPPPESREPGSAAGGALGRRRSCPPSCRGRGCASFPVPGGPPERTGRAQAPGREELQLGRRALAGGHWPLLASPAPGGTPPSPRFSPLWTEMPPVGSTSYDKNWNRSSASCPATAEGGGTGCGAGRLGPELSSGLSPGSGGAWGQGEGGPRSNMPPAHLGAPFISAFLWAL
uniref:Uncharacterized protein n=1 Tax=Mustela putorius furo TaxID=9669 RepID=M3Z752_MUSPF